MTHGVRPQLGLPLAVPTEPPCPCREGRSGRLSQGSNPAVPWPWAWPRRNVQTEGRGWTIFLSPEDRSVATLCFAAVFCNPSRSWEMCFSSWLMNWSHHESLQLWAEGRWVVFLRWQDLWVLFRKGFWWRTLKMTEIKLATSPDPKPLQLTFWRLPVIMASLPPSSSLAWTLISLF